VIESCNVTVLDRIGHYTAQAEPELSEAPHDVEKLKFCRIRSHRRRKLFPPCSDVCPISCSFPIPAILLPLHSWHVVPDHIMFSFRQSLSAYQHWLSCLLSLPSATCARSWRPQRSGIMDCWRGHGDVVRVGHGVKGTRKSLV